MTKPGYTHIIVPTELHKKLKTLAQQNHTSINQVITQLININVNVDVSINTGINTLTPLTLQNQASIQLTEKPENSRFSKNQRLVGLPGFEPGSFPYKAQSPALREPKSPSLDQASRQPHTTL